MFILEREDVSQEKKMNEIQEIFSVRRERTRKTSYYLTNLILILREINKKGK